jgi:hypothetical protein
VGKGWRLKIEPLEIGENVGRCDIIAAWLADVGTFIEMFVGQNERMIPMHIGESVFPGKMLEKCWEEDWIGKLKNLILT